MANSVRAKLGQMVIILSSFLKKPHPQTSGNQDKLVYSSKD